jgi:hypothetical protein
MQKRTQTHTYVRIQAQTGERIASIWIRKQQAAAVLVTNAKQASIKPNQQPEEEAAAAAAVVIVVRGRTAELCLPKVHPRCRSGQSRPAAANAAAGRGSVVRPTVKSTASLARRRRLVATRRQSRLPVPVRPVLSVATSTSTSSAAAAIVSGWVVVLTRSGALSLSLHCDVK